MFKFVRISALSVSVSVDLMSEHLNRSALEPGCLCSCVYCTSFSVE